MSHPHDTIESDPEVLAMQLKLAEARDRAAERLKEQAAKEQADKLEKERKKAEKLAALQRQIDQVRVFLSVGLLTLLCSWRA